MSAKCPESIKQLRREMQHRHHQTTVYRPLGVNRSLNSAFDAVASEEDAITVPERAFFLCHNETLYSDFIESFQ